MLMLISSSTLPVGLESFEEDSVVKTKTSPNNL